MSPQDPTSAPMQTALPTPVSQAPTPAVAEDTDVIEYEWVKQAEDVVAKTQHDPYQQARDLALLKADYMQKRYAKTVKVVEE